jgi:carbamoyltransferase
MCAAEAAADLLAQGSVIGWVQGRSEFGPRALGNRSILADPRPAANKEVINAMVKKREGFRPFAPSVLEERLRDYFEVPAATTALPFMIIVVPVREHARATLGAVTHIDGSARVQTVARADNPRFHALIEGFGRRTGVPLVLNTSFNNNAEPIVDSVDDAITTFLTTGIGAMVIGDWLVRKPEESALLAGLLELVPSLPPGRKLVRSVRAAMARCGIEGVGARYSSESEVAVSPGCYRVLSEESPLRVSCRRLGLEDPAVLEALCRECYDLWCRRAIRLLPPSTQ